MTHIAAALGSEGPVEESLLVELSRKVIRPWLQSNDEPPSLGHITYLWHRLVLSVCNSQGSEKYLTTACNAVSVFLATSSVSQNDAFHVFAFSKPVWLDGYKCAQKALDRGKTKPALQVLETLCLLLNEHSDKQVASTVLLDTTRTLLKVILVDGLHHDIKVACIALSCFIKKTTVVTDVPQLIVEAISEVGFSWHRHLKQHNLTLEDADRVKRHYGAIFLPLLMWIRSLETRSAALKLLTLVCTRTDDEAESQRLFLHAALTTELYVDKNNDLLGDFADNVFPVVLDDRARWQTFVDAFWSRSQESHSKLSQFLVVLRLGKVKNFISEEGLAELIAPLGIPQQTEHDVLLQLLQSSSATVRIQTYNILVATHLTGAKVSTKTLDCISRGWRYLHDDNNAYERGEVLSVSRRLLRRIDHGLTKQAATVYSMSEASIFASHYLAFLKDLVCFLERELYPTISYPRHILALQTLQIVLNLQSGKQCDLKSLCKPLLSLVLDPFEDVRTTSTALCQSLFRRFECVSRQSLLWNVARQVEVLSAKTCRHDHADAAGRLFSLAQSISDHPLRSRSALGRLEIYISSTAALTPRSTTPLHALLLGATYYLPGSNPASRKSTIDEDHNIIRICQRVWKLVQGQLCVDSPETATSDSMKSSVGPKDLLAYSWRALRDSSLLLQALLQTYEIDHQTLSVAGLLCIEQLTMLRHRGAFSTVAQTFVICCELARTSSNPVSNQLIKDWYVLAGQEIRKQAGKLTRRSAGLPALINALLSPDDPVFFDSMIRDLELQASRPVAPAQASEREVELPQVHALNCLKDIMHNSRFRTINDRFLGKLLELGANTISSEVWAIRNSGLMLMRACMVRLEPNGPATNSSTGVSEVQRTREEPLQIAINLLEKGDIAECGHLSHIAEVPQYRTQPTARTTPRSENIFAALDLVKYVGHASYENSRLQSSIITQLKNQIWAIRDHAARVLVGRVELEGNLHDPLSVCLLESDCSENELHGYLLFCRYCLKAQREHSSDEDINESVEGLADILHTLVARVPTHSSSFTKAALLEIVNDSLSFIVSTGRTLSDLESPLAKMQRRFSLEDNGYCRERLLFSRTLIYLLSGSEFADRKFIMIGETALEALSQDMSSNPDETKYVLGRLQESNPMDAVAQMRFTDILCRLSMDTTFNDIRALALTVLAEFLETNEQMATYFCDAAMDTTRIAMEKLFAAAYGDDRELWNASLRIWAFFIRAHLCLSHAIPDAAMTLVVSSCEDLLNQLCAAGRHTTELPTRLGAAVALRTCIAQVMTLRSKRDLKYTHLTTKALTLLYDQLNDDDEDIRKVAMQSTAQVVHRWPGKPTDGQELLICALASREAVIRLMLEPAGHKTREKRKMVCLFAIRCIMGSSCDHVAISELSLEQILVDSVENRLQWINASINDLFAEERQNLYVDELEEVAVWSRVLIQCVSPSDDGLSALIPWVSDGLDQIKAVLDASEGKQQMPLGPTYNSDILVLFVKVISLASVLTMRLGPHAMDSGKEPLTAKLEALKKALVEYDASERVLMAFDAGKEAEKEENLSL